MKVYHISKQYGIMVLLVTALLSACSSNKGGSDIVPPEAPAGLSGNAISATEAELSWTDNSTTEEGFKIERQQGSGNFTVVGTVSSNITSFRDVNLVTNQTYIYRVASFNDAGQSQGYSNTVTITPNNLPVIATKTATEVSFHYVLSGGSIYSDGGSPVIARGVCWNQSGNPTIALPTKTIDSSGTGSYTSFVSNLTEGASYYIRAYATNANGTSYGQQVQVTADVIDTVVIRGKVWMKYNLNVTRYRNGDRIPVADEFPNWNQASFTTGVQSVNPGVYNIDPKLYGRLYNLYAARDPRGIAPAGWRVAKKSDFANLDSAIASIPNNAGSLKMTGTVHWIAPNSAATNSTGFSAVAAGIRRMDGFFVSDHKNTDYWITDLLPYPNFGSTYFLYHNSSRLEKADREANHLLSIRCVKE